ncbi:hypothetical protein Leryth_018604 [Lithospermum erythrorhizon]|uniref:Vacuolar protein sorting-associated protein 62 n=1 Tax=Lithospermum erythrorhizon TaxID=34254 RepID=A0AAV3RWN7_LITER|nr:hypothetical protein Leryth_018604 [Lithospermum erythrorhizon]
MSSILTCVGFGNGAIDLGGLLICQIKNLTEQSSLPDGFFVLGNYSQSNTNFPSGILFAGKDVTNDPSRVILKSPIDYILVTSPANDQEGGAYIWQPLPPENYTAIGNVATGSSDKPPLDDIRCVLSDFVEIIQEGGNISPHIPTGTFLARGNESTISSFMYLKNVAGNISSMPNISQLDDLIKKYSPVIYFHPDEEFFPSPVSFFFENGGLLYTKGQESNPVPIDPTGSNLPQGGSDDELYWLDMPIDDAARGKVKTGSLETAGAYIHAKPTLGATCTDLAIWIFYPYNGPARAKVEFFNINFRHIGQHVGDWEHVTLRISNLNGELESVYFAQHAKGVWLNANEIEYQSGTKPVVYSSYHGHAAYPFQGINLIGNGNIGIRNDAAKGDRFMDTGVNYSIVSADYLSPPIVEPTWLNYTRKWGPTITSDFADDLSKFTKFLPGKLKRKFMDMFNKLPKEVMGQEGPTGPKWKASWDGDENV